MIELSTGFVEPVSAPPPSPIEQTIDVTHLARMTLGDASLEREVLRLFDRQAEMLLARMRMPGPAAAAAAHAHTLKGSSSGIGAWKVAKAADDVEQAAAIGEAEVEAAIERLATTIGEARAVIADLLRAH
jgi:HPt (histidine-containing phosphotransfer) domain-containing protein